MKGRNSGNFSNPCLTMHQPWASLLVYGIKRIEGRSWPAPLRGRLWIHAAGKVPEQSTIKAMEDFYREIYALDGITDLKFPEHYPVSRLVGCVEVVGCVRGDELKTWDKVPEGVRLEAQTDFCWLCEQPQKLLIPFEMRGFQGVYNLEKKIFEAAIRGLTHVKCPLPVKFQLRDPRDPFSLKPGSISSCSPETRGSGSEVEKSSKLNAVIAGARAAATQFSRKYPDPQPSVQNYTTDLGRAGNSRTEFLGEDKFQSTNFHHDKVSRANIEEQSSSYHPRPRARFAHPQQQNGGAGNSRTEFWGEDKFQSTNFHQDKVSRANIEEHSSSYHPRPRALFAHPQQQNGGAGNSRTEFWGEDKFQSTNFHQDKVSRANIEEHSSSSHPRPRALFAHSQQRNGRAGSSRTEFLGEDKFQSTNFHQDGVSQAYIEEQSSNYHPRPRALFAHPQQQKEAPSKIFAAALKGLKPT